MSELTMRPITRDDVTRVRTFMAAVEAVDQTGEHYSEDDIVEELESPLTDPGTDWVLAEVSDEIVGHWRLFPRAPSGGEHGVSLDGAVHPAHRGKGHGTILVADMVARGRAYVLERDPANKPVLMADGPSDNGDQESLFGAVGLVPNRWAFQMAADLRNEVPVSDELPEGLRLRVYDGQRDATALFEAHNIAFLDHPNFMPWDEAMWTQWVTGSRSFRPDLSFIVEDETGAIAAYVQSNVYDSTFETTGIREVYIAKVGTLRAHRGKGLAGALLRHTLRAGQAVGLERATLDVDSVNPTGALGVYERAGFTAHQRWTNYRLEG